MSYLVAPSFTAGSGTMLTETVLESISLRYVSSIVRPSPLLFLISLAFLLVLGLMVLPKMRMLTIITPPPPKASASSAPSICLL